jgi:hypothetical protein
VVECVVIVVFCVVFFGHQKHATFSNFIFGLFPFWELRQEAGPPASRKDDNQKATAKATTDSQFGYAQGGLFGNDNKKAKTTAKQRQGCVSDRR